MPTLTSVKRVDGKFINGSIATSIIEAHDRGKISLLINGITVKIKRADADQNDRRIIIVEVDDG